MIVVYALLFLSSIYSLLWYYFKVKKWCRSQICLVGKTAIVTGANTGIGFETAIDFAKRGARVILACRNKQKAETAKRKIIRETGNKDVVVKNLDLASFDSVRTFAEDINNNEERLDILVNNAGVTGIENETSEDNLVLIMQINYFSSFLLTNLLIDLLKRSGPSRVINVSSKEAKRAKFELEKLNTFTGQRNDYCCSKLCNILFTKELSKRLKGSKVTTFSVHPGTVKSEIFRNLKGHCKQIVDFMADHFFRTCEEGAQTVIFTAVEKGIESLNGEHFDDCKMIEPYSTTLDVQLPKKLWELSEQLTLLTSEEKRL